MRWLFNFFGVGKKPKAATAESKKQKPYEQWVQERLNAHGASLEVDGRWGTASVAAIKEFQRKKKLPISGMADKATHNLLKLQPGNSKARPVPSPAKRMPEWLTEMTRIMGLHEVHNNTSLIEYMRIGKYLGNPKDLPWCGDAVESTMVKSIACVVPSNPFLAINWRKWGQVCKAICGAVAIIQWKPGKSAGHIGYLIDVRKNSQGEIIAYKIRGGNQGNKVKDSWFKASSFYKIDFRWPADVPIENYPFIKGAAAAGGGLKETR